MNTSFIRKKKSTVSELKAASLNAILLAESLANCRSEEQRKALKALLREFKKNYQATFLDDEILPFDERMSTTLKIAQIVYELYPDFKAENLPALVFTVEEIQASKPVTLEISSDFIVAMDVYQVLKNM